MWKNNRNSVNKVFKEWVARVFVYDLLKYFTTYPQANQKQKTKHSLLEARYRLYTYPHL